MPRPRRLPPLLPGALAVVCALAALGTRPALAEPALAAASGPTVFGATVQLLPQEHYAAGIARIEAVEGHLGTVRMFQQVPKPRVLAALADRSGMFSFDLPPDQVLAGDFDDDFSGFFTAAPRDHPTWWTYFHEPDVAHAQGRLPDLGQYRAASAHVAALAQAVGNPQLHDTVVLTGWAANPTSHLDPADYLPDDHDLIDLMAWDNYNGYWIRQGSYGDPHRMVSLDQQAAAALGKPFGVAEFGSVVLGDDVDGRAAWITAFAGAARDAGAVFADYYDSDQYGKGADYRLTDAPSQAAYRQVLQDGG